MSDVGGHDQLFIYAKLCAAYAILTVWDSIFSFHYVSLCVFILPVGRHAMLLQCANIYAGTGHSNTKYNFIGLDSLRDKLCRFATVNHDWTTQLWIIITGLHKDIYTTPQRKKMGNPGDSDKIFVYNSRDPDMPLLSNINCG